MKKIPNLKRDDYIWKCKTCNITQTQHDDIEKCNNRRRMEE